MDNFLSHTGVAHDDSPPGRGSGRYAWGSGENPGQHQFNFLSEVDRLRKNGIKNADIAKMLLGDKATTTDLRAEISIETKKQRQANRARAIQLLEECNGNKSEVGRRMGISESSVRSLLDPVIAERTDRYENTANMLKKVIAEKGAIDVSSGTELYMGITDHTKKVAISMLEKEGYIKTWVQIPQLGTQHKTSVMVLAAPPEDGKTKKDVFSEVQKNKYNISSVQEFTPDQGKTWWTPEYPSSVNSDRVMIRYKEDGGKEKDGVIEIRRGVEDLSLGNSQYAQVRIAVDNSHYMKGMAIYASEDEMKSLPKGVDIIYNTNKSAGTPKEDVFKKMKRNETTGEIDKDNPFGASIKRGGQHYYVDKNGNEKLSPINKLQEEGDWDSWSRNLSSQFLSKQKQKLIDQQIKISLADKKADLDDILNLTNPVIKKKLLVEYADHCDSNASELSVKGFKNQAFQVLLPIPSLKDNECYAPKFDDGETVALIRYPHGGTFEIPILKVNNKHESAKSVMFNAQDAIGINNRVADILSGADFDGDAALVIPITSNRLKITATKPLEGLVNFDHKEIYKLPPDAPKIKPSTKQNEMGRVSNLITDMTIGGATFPEIEKAVKHSMVVIDAEKHHLDYKKSYMDNDINELKKIYQGFNEETGQVKGASTIISKAGAEVYIPKRKEVTDVKKMTPSELKRWNNGEKIYRNTNETRLEQIKDPTKMTEDELSLYNSGRKVYRDSGKLKTEKVHRMDVVDDAMDLVRDKSNEKEVAYANYANELKKLANTARKEARSIQRIPVSPTAKKTYAEEVESLNRKLRIAEMNSPRERQAQTIGNAELLEKIKSNPGMDYEHRQREAARCLNKARAQVGASKEKIVITEKEYEAIQSNAISTDRLMRILNNTDQDAFRKMATPRFTGTLSSAQIAKAKAMAASGMYTQKEIADSLGVSASTVSNALKSN